jgi:DNA-binding NtrC family response regulator
MQLTRVAAVNLIGRSRAFVETVRLIERIAGTDAPVLIEGETGTGKEVAARAIHYGGTRRDRPFVPINCGAIPEALIANELFGHVRGAYTDARDPQPGLVSLANGGTLFLDEIDALCARGQIALLRFLQDFTYRPLGSRKEERVDVRIIAATNADLPQLIAARGFREDLYYRLRILTVRLPPLRERPGDPQLLAEHFVRTLCALHGCSEKRLDPTAIAFLDAYRWPGNVRELENLVQRSILLNEGDTVGPGLLQELMPDSWPAPDPAASSELGFQQAKARAVAAFERAYVADLLARSQGNVSLAARLSGKERSRFSKLMKKHGIERRRYTAER